MSFLEKFLIVSKLEEGAGETMSFRAQDTWTGQAVLLHQVLPGRNLPHQPDLTAMVFKHLTGAIAPGAEHFLEIGQDEDRIFVVTTDVPECEDLRQWLQFIDASREGRGAFAGSPTPQSAWPQPADSDFGATQVIADAPVAETPVAPTQSAHQPGDFTHMFSAPSGTTNPPASSPPKKDDVSFRPPAPLPSPELSAEPAAKPPGKAPRGQVPSGFEVVFQSRKQSSGSPPEPSAPATVPPSPATAKPGEFTQMFSAIGSGTVPPPTAQTPRTPSKPPSVPSPAGGKEHPGEFTLMFSNMGKAPEVQPLPPSPPASNRPPSVSPSQPKSAKAGPGEFTQMFMGVSKGPSTQPPASSPPAPSRPPGVPSPPAPAAKAGPGEFTQMFEAPTVVTAPPSMRPASPDMTEPPAPPPAPPAPGPTAFPPSSPSDSRGPGEFTRMFQTGGAPIGRTPSPGIGSLGQPSAPLPGTKSGLGELTQLMQGYKSPTATPPPPAALEAPPPPPAPEPVKKGPGEYTMLFRQPPPAAVPVAAAGPPTVTVQPPPAPPKPPQPGAYTSMFEAPRMPAAPAPPAAPSAAPQVGYGFPAAPPPPAMPPMPTYQAPPPPPVAAPQPPQFQPPPPPTFAVAAPPAPQAMPPAGTKKPGIFWVLVLGLGGLFLIAVVLVLFFAFKH